MLSLSCQVWVYEDMDETGESNLFVHHDIILPAFPLSVAWMDCNLADTSATANLAAVCQPFMYLVLGAPNVVPYVL